MPWRGLRGKRVSRWLAVERAVGEVSMVWLYVGFVEAMREREVVVRMCEVSWRVVRSLYRVERGVWRRSGAVRMIGLLSTPASVAFGSSSGCMDCILGWRGRYV